MSHHDLIANARAEATKDRSGRVERMLRDAVRRVHAAYGITPPAQLEPGEGER